MTAVHHLPGKCNLSQKCIQTSTCVFSVKHFLNTVLKVLNEYFNLHSLKKSRFTEKRKISASLPHYKVSTTGNNFLTTQFSAHWHITSANSHDAFLLILNVTPLTLISFSISGKCAWKHWLSLHSLSNIYVQDLPHDLHYMSKIVFIKYRKSLFGYINEY